MIEAIVGGYLLVGSVCVIEGEQFGQCREVPAVSFGNKYACDSRLEQILESFPYVPSEGLGFPSGERLRVQVRCKAATAGI